MNELETLLEKEGVLTAFVRNCNLEKIRSGDINLANAFIWSKTKEGCMFWLNLYKLYKGYAIHRNRLIELKQKFQLYPPRYKENL